MAIDIEHELDKLETVDGSGTQLVSLYVPKDKDLQSVINRLRSEQAETENIKSKQTRQNVQRAISLVLDQLNQVTEDTGIVCFGGVDRDDDEHQVTVLDDRVDSFRYHCDSEFLTEPLREIRNDYDTYALIVVERRAATLGTLTGDRVDHIKDLKSNAKGKHSAGGFSNRRFDRLIEESTDNFYDEVADEAYKIYDVDELDGVLIGGTNITRDDFVDHLHHELQDEILGSFSVDYHGMEGLKDLVSRADETITDARQQTARRAVERFMKRLQGDEPVTYGLGPVQRATEMGAVDTLLVGRSKRYNDDIDELVDDVEDMGGDVVVVSDEFEAGVQFNGVFDGVGGLLRFPVE